MPNTKGKEVVQEGPARQPAKPKKAVSEEEMAEFYKVIREGEYDVVEQLKKAPAKISIMSLLNSSDIHRKSLLEVLKEAHVPTDIEEDKFKNLVGSILVTNHLSFSEEELTSDGIGHVHALHIQAQCKGMNIPKVLVDNGSAINIVPRSILNSLPVDHSRMRAQTSVVRAFDDSRRTVEGMITLPITIGPVVFDIDFHVMDIQPSFNMLLGRPWIHTAGAIPSTLHQMIKFVANGKVVTVYGEQTRADRAKMVEPCDEVDTDWEISGFHAIEIVNATYEGGNPRRNPMVDQAARYLLSRAYQPGKGLGRRLQGRFQPLIQIYHERGFGIGYRPSAKELRENRTQRKRKRLARLSGVRQLEPPLEIPPISWTFVMPTGAAQPTQRAHTRARIVYRGESSRSSPDGPLEEDYGISRLFTVAADGTLNLEMEDLSVNVIIKEEESASFPYPSEGQPLGNWAFDVQAERLPAK